MPKSLSMLLDIDPSDLTDRDAFDPILDLDTRLFIDPHLLKHTEVPELKGSYTKLQQHFRAIGKLLAASDTDGDAFWRRADAMMKWPEVKGLCIGYSKGGTSGSGIGPDLRKRLLRTAKEIINKGKDDPELFELVGLLEEDFGSDRISDMTANIIKGDLEEFTKRVLAELDVNIAEKLGVLPSTGLPINPFTHKTLLLVPKSLLRDLPVALDWSSRDIISQHNQELREKVNLIIGSTWKEAIDSLTKEELKKYVLENPGLLDDLVTLYAAKAAQPYNFQEDRAGEFIWFPVARKVAKEQPLIITLPDSPSIDDVEKMVLAICGKFKSLVEDNALSELFYNNDGTVKHEKAAQLLFYGIADAYCDSNGILIARESDSGRGPVDFKFGTKMENSVLVELKKSTNTSGLTKGIEKQLPQYMKSEKSKRAIYLVLDVGYTKAAIDRLKEVNAKIKGAAIKIIHVDATPKVSASRL